MSRSDRIKLVAFGLAVAVLIFLGFSSWRTYHDENAQKRESAAYEDRDATQKATKIICEASGNGATTCTVQPPDSEQIDKHTQIDLNAQQDVADWTYASVLIAIGGLFVTVVGTIYVARNLRLTKTAIDIADHNARNQSRAYVHIDEANFYHGEGIPRIMVKVVNTGSTPAKWIEIKSHLFNTDALKKGDVVENKIFPAQYIEGYSAFRRSALGAQSDYEIPPTQVGYANVFNEAVTSKNALVLNVAGVVRYKTIYGEVFESQFWFVKYPPHNTKINRHPDAAPGLATFGTHTIIAQPMIREICDLRTYERVEE